MARVRVQVPVEPDMVKPEPPQSEIQSSNPSSGTRRQLLTRNNILVGIVLLAVVIFIFNLLSDRKKLEDKVNKLSTNQSSNPQNDAQKYQDAVSKLVEVPNGSMPAVKIPTQDEITSLSKDNSLYNTAKPGDVFLIYTNQDKSLFLVIYRPSSGKVILAAQASQQSTATPAQAKKP